MAKRKPKTKHTWHLKHLIITFISSKGSCFSKYLHFMTLKLYSSLQIFHTWPFGVRFSETLLSQKWAASWNMDFTVKSITIWITNVDKLYTASTELCLSSWYNYFAGLLCVKNLKSTPKYLFVPGTQQSIDSTVFSFTNVYKSYLFCQVIFTNRNRVLIHASPRLNCGLQGLYLRMGKEIVSDFKVPHSSD